MDFYKDFPERSDSGTATTPDGGIVAGSDKLNDNDYAMIGANGTGSNSQGKGYKVKFSSIYNYLKGKLLGEKHRTIIVENLDADIVNITYTGCIKDSTYQKKVVEFGWGEGTFNDFVKISTPGNTAQKSLILGSNGRAQWDGKNIMLQTQTLAASYIAERYSIDEEQALTRRMIANDPTVVEQFEAYNAYCEECKAKAKEELANQPQVLPDTE